MEAKQYVTKQPMDHRRNQRGNKKYIESNENKNTTIQNLWDAAKAVLKREVYSNAVLPQETNKKFSNHLTLHLKQLEKEKETKCRVSRRKEIIKIRAEINETDKENKRKDQ